MGDQLLVQPWHPTAVASIGFFTREVRMLEEIGSPGEPEGDYVKRWFTDSYFDLYVWLDAEENVVSFQLCYEKPNDEHALTWKRPHSFYHQQVDDGENRPGKSKSTPILLPDGLVNADALASRFSKESKSVDSAIATFVLQKIGEFGKRVTAR